MIETLKQTMLKARKNHDCMACEWINNAGVPLRGYTFTFSEWRALINARENNWQIQKGDLYLNQRNIDCGDIFTFKAIPAIHDICIKYDYYDV